ncbi:MAG: type II toxin-antitoxin system PemK/MazF family toxin [Planctomycetes bacterium]|nr:type II toxin-antitoxin system PemK/MazF family toxin [Planctomycetota bacterium]
MTRGDVVEVEWPYSDMTGSKMRPALVVQGDLLNHLIDDTILVQIAGTRHGIPGTEVLLDPAAEFGSGLSKICVASCMNITTFEQALLRRIGYLSDAAMQQIEECLKLVMDFR